MEPSPERLGVVGAIVQDLLVSESDGQRNNPNILRDREIMGIVGSGVRHDANGQINLSMVAERQTWRHPRLLAVTLMPRI